MQANVTMKADYDGDLGTNEAGGYGGELESDILSNNDNSNCSPRVMDGGETIELQPLIADSQNAQRNNYV